MVCLQSSILNPKNTNWVFSGTLKLPKVTSNISHSAIYCVYWPKITNSSWNSINLEVFNDSLYPHEPLCLSRLPKSLLRLSSSSSSIPSPWSKLYIPSTLNIDLILWHTQMIVCAENVKSWFKSWVFPFTFQAYILPHTLNCMSVSLFKFHI